LSTEISWKDIFAGFCQQKNYSIFSQNSQKNWLFLQSVCFDSLFCIYLYFWLDKCPTV